MVGGHVMLSEPTGGKTKNNNTPLMYCLNSTIMQILQIIQFAYRITVTTCSG